MIPIFIDIGDVGAEFGLTPQEARDMIDSVIKGVTSRFYENWATQARNNLGSTRSQYLRSLIVLDEGKMKGSVMLSGLLPYMIEEGANAFDMKEGFAKSSKIKTNKNGGWYLTIPFRLATPGAGGFSEVFSGSVPQTVFKVIKSKSIQSSGRTKGLSAGEIPQEHKAPRIRPTINMSGNKKFDEYKSKTSIYQGVTRQASTGQVTSFRRVGSNSDPNSWIHKGITARKFAEKALKETDINQEVDRGVDNFLSSLGF